MELSEQANSLTKEKIAEMFEDLQNEHVALDNSYLSSIRECLSLRKLIVIKDKAINDLTSQIQKLMGIKDESASIIPANACSNITDTESPSAE